MENEVVELTMEEILEELEFLRYFFDAAQESFGPANGDVTCFIVEDYENETGNTVPEEYDWRN